MKTCVKCNTEKVDIEFSKLPVLTRKNINKVKIVCNQCKTEYRKAHFEKYRDKYTIDIKYNRIKNRYGLSREEYDKIPKVCTICGDREDLCVDHNHQSGRIRGMLCRMCNTGLGHFKDHPVLLDRASNYVLGLINSDIFTKEK